MSLLESALRLATAGAASLLCVAVSTLATAAAPIWIQVQDARAWSPLMTPASRVGLMEAESLGEFLVPMVTATEEKPAPDCWAEFSIVAPKSGSYWLWGRVRFPAGPEESFRVVSTNTGENPRELILAQETTRDIGTGSVAAHCHCRRAPGRFGFSRTAQWRRRLARCTGGRPS